jgi:predicted dehydrogenase
MIRFGIVGSGWRSLFFLRIARACPDRFAVTGLVVRSLEKAAPVAREFGVDLFTSIEEMVEKSQPLFVVSCVPWEVNPGVLKRLAELGVPVLSETPPATTVEEMVELWRLVEGGANIQVAEQYWLQPHHAARIAFARSGRLGRISQAQVSVAHGYHGISLIRRYLDIGFDEAEVSAHAFSSPIVQSPGRDGPPAEERIVDSGQTIARFDFGDRMGIFDFCGDQYFSHVRGQRLLVRGARGEIIDHGAVYLRDHATPIRVTFERLMAGPNGNLEGNFLKGIQAGEEWIYRNPLAPGSLADDEIGIGDCLLRMAVCAEGGADCYSLAEACQDRYLDILMQESLDAGKPIETKRQPWAS